MARRKRRIRCKYTAMGERIAGFGKQYELARLLGVSQQTISKKLRGECAVSVSDLETLARRLHVPIGAFFDWNEMSCEWHCPKCGRKQWVSYGMLVDVGNPICSVCDVAMNLPDDAES